MIDTDMDEIIPGLYVGGWHAARDIKAHRLPIGIVTVAVDSEVIGDYHAKLSDGYGNDESEFAEAVQLVYVSICREVPTLVHCIAGRSRSAAVVVAALMRAKGMTISEAYDLVKSKRMIQIHPGFTRLMESVGMPL